MFVTHIIAYVHSIWCKCQFDVLYISPTQSLTNAMTYELLSVYICNTDYRIHIYYIYVCNTYYRTGPFNIVFLPLHTIISVWCIIYIANSRTHERNDPRTSLSPLTWTHTHQTQTLTNSCLFTDMHTHSSNSTTRGHNHSRTPLSVLTCTHTHQTHSPTNAITFEILYPY